MGRLWSKIGSFFLRIFRPGKARRRKLAATVPENLGTFFGCDEFIITKTATAGDANYAVFHIWKDQARTKQRQIEAPNPELKRLQRIILKQFLYRFAPSACSHGFVGGRSIVSNAALHTGRKFVLKLDLRDFFPSVTEAMIWREWRENGVATPETEPRLRTLLRLCLYRGRLPQGAPTSPALANIVCRRLDHALVKFARRNGMAFSRYADDLTFSGDSELCYRLIPPIRRIVESCGFRVNDKKVNVLKQHKRQTVTGLVVNHAGRTGVKRRTRMKLRAYMHQILTGKIPPDRVNLPKLRGHVAFLQHADPDHGAFFAGQLRQIEEKSETGL